MIYANVGRRLRGKSTLALYIARRSPQRIIFDPRGLIGTPARIQTYQEFSAAWELFTLQPDNREMVEEIVITPYDHVDAFFAHVCDALRQLVRDEPDRALTLLVDEVRFVDLRNSAFDWLLRCADPRRVHVILTCHGWIDIPADIRRICDHFLLFHTTERLDLKSIEERCGDRARALVETLGPYEFVQWDDGVGQLYECRDPGAWFVPLNPEDAPRNLPGGGPDDLTSELPRSARAPFDKPATLF